MGATRRDGSLPRYATVFRRPGKTRKDADTNARRGTLGSSRGCGGPFGGRRGTHSEMERREDGQRESVQHHVDAATETDAFQIAAPQPHAGSCDRARSDLASGRKTPSWFAATHAAKVFAATSSGAGGRGLARELEMGVGDRNSEGSAAAAMGAAQAHASAVGMWTHLWRSDRHWPMGATCRSRSW